MELTDKAAEILGDKSKVTSPKKKIVEDEGSFKTLRKILRKKIASGEEYFIIKNPLESVFHTDWSLPLLPTDIKPDAEKYFGEKYVQFGGDKFIPGVSFVVVQRPDNSAVNLLENFLIEKEVPTAIPISVGGETVIKSQFVMNPGEALLVSEEQKDDLLRFVKWRREWMDSDNVLKKSDWLGFLILSSVTEENVSDIYFDRPILSREDFSLMPVQASVKRKTRKEVRRGDMIFADATD